jgi:O-acetylhomoserine/O-acetylserine sulfhydrylase-like pyridoxal-dependent enzyme
MDNPTTQVLADCIAALEGQGAGASVALSSGQAATTSVMLALAKPGGTWLIADQVFGGTASVASKILEPLGVNVRYVAPELNAVRDALDDTTLGVWVETIANPSGFVPDLPALAQVAHDRGVPLIVDNTWGAGGYLCRPLDHGADAVVHSTTKWIGGHGVAIGGAVVDGGTFDWGAHPERYPGFSKTNARGQSILDQAPDHPLAARVVDLGLSTMGMTLSPFASFLFLQGIQTLELRVQRACGAALDLAHRLQALPGVARIVYPGLPDHPSHATAKRILTYGFGTVLGVVFDSEAIARGTLDRLELVSHLANIGDAKTVAIQPWATTHAGLSDDAKRVAGVVPELVRISVGIEHLEDVFEDLDRAIRGATAAVG